VQAEAKAYRSVEELPEVLGPSRYVIEGGEVEVYEPVDRNTLLREVRKVKEYLGRYGKEGWV